MLGKLAGLVLCATVSGSLLAQERPPALVVKVGDKPEPLAVTAVRAEARIFGCLAETRLTLTFANPHDRQFEGELYFPLPEGSTVSGYALDINSQMVDGVVVEKDRGRQIFEEVERQGIDPGLVEWTKGNNFKTRVFPIPAKGTRTVMVRYVAELASKGDAAEYRLPLAFKDKVKDASIRIEVLKPAKAPVLSECGLDGLQFVKWEGSYVAEKKLQNAVLDKDLVVELPEAARQQVLVEKAPDGAFHFCISDLPLDPRAEKLLKASAPPRRLTILWDASGSRGTEARKRELGFLKNYFAQIKKGKVSVELVLFRNVAAAPVAFTVEAGNADKLLAALGKVDYDGGTQLSCISPAPKAKAPDGYFLFTDGIHNFGREQPAGFKAPVYVFTADAGANAPFLKHLAASTGGQYFNLLALADEPVAVAIGHEPYSFISATADGKDVADLVPGSAEPVAGRFTLSGRITAAETVVTVNYGTGTRVEQKRKFRIAREEAAEGELLRRHWAQKKLQELLVSPKKSEKDIVDLGKKHGLVTPGTSLLVLDNVQQYIRYRVRPPAAQPAWRAEFDKAIEEIEHQAKAEEKSKIEHVLELWQERVKWWETEFKYPANLKVKEPEGGGGLAVATGSTADPAVPARTAPPPPPSPAPPPRTEAPVTAPKPAEEAKDELKMVIYDVQDLVRQVPNFPGPMLGLAAGTAGKETAGEGRSVNAGISVKPWDPKTPYMEALKKAGAAEAFPVYLEQRKKYSASPAFFLDAADYFFAQKQPEIGLQVLSNLAELELENAALLRVLAHRLAQLGMLDLAASVFEEALRLRPEEPQSWRDLALVLAQQKQYPRAMELLAHVVMNKWDRFDEIEVIALMELNNIIPKAKTVGTVELPVDPRLVKLLAVDVRIVLTWDADLTDIDLHVIEPSGEEALFSHNRTTIGGLVSRDFTQGYGPEEYLVRKAMPGAYKVQTNFFGSRAQQLTGAVTLQVEIFTNYGRAGEKKQTLTVRLTEQKETIDIGEVKL